MKNSRISAKERGLLKGAIRRVFSRSDLRHAVVAACQIDHFDPKRPRVKKWGRCSTCKEPTALYQLEVDHLLPIIPVHLSLEEITWDELINNVFCEEKNLAPKCSACHKRKTKEENSLRRKLKKERSK